MHPLRFLIRHFDNWLSRRYGVYVFDRGEEMILRLQEGRAEKDMVLRDGFVAGGSRVLFLHLWNERLPPVPPTGPDVAYALRLQRRLVHSLQAVAHYLVQTPRLQEVRAIGGVSAHSAFQETGSGRLLLEHLGFTVLPYHSPAGAFGEFWENFYAWWLMWAFNPAGARRCPFWKLQRLEFWMTDRTFLERYGPAAVDPARPSC